MQFYAQIKRMFDYNSVVSFLEKNHCLRRKLKSLSEQEINRHAYGNINWECNSQSHRQI